MLYTKVGFKMLRTFSQKNSDKSEKQNFQLNTNKISFILSQEEQYE